MDVKKGNEGEEEELMLHRVVVGGKAGRDCAIRLVAKIIPTTNKR